MLELGGMGVAEYETTRLVTSLKGETAISYRLLAKYERKNNSNIFNELLDIIQFNSKDHFYRPPLSKVHFGRA